MNKQEKKKQKEIIRKEQREREKINKLKKIEDALNGESEPAKHIQSNETAHQEPQTKHRFSRKTKNWLKIATAILLFLFAMFGPIQGWKDIFKSRKEKFKEERFIEGDLTGPKIKVSNGENQDGYLIFRNNTLTITDSVKNNSSINRLPKIKGILIEKFNDSNFVNRGAITLSIGNDIIQVSPKQLLTGINVFQRSPDPCKPDKPLLVGVHKNRLYISVEFKDLEKNHVGTIEFNHWSLYKENILDFDNNDKQLEVRDKRNRIIMQVEYEDLEPDTHLPFQRLENVVRISGYLVGTKKTTVFYRKNNIDSDGSIHTSAFTNCYNNNDPNYTIKIDEMLKSIRSDFGHPSL